MIIYPLWIMIVIAAFLFCALIVLIVYLLSKVKVWTRFAIAVGVIVPTLCWIFCHSIGFNIFVTYVGLGNAWLAIQIENDIVLSDDPSMEEYFDQNDKSIFP